MPEGQRVWSIEVFHASAILDIVVGSALGDKRANELAHKPTLWLYLRYRVHGREHRP